MKLSQRAIFRSVIGLLVVYPTLIALSYGYGEYYAQALLPLYKSMIGLIGEDYEVRRISVVQMKNQKVIEAVLVNRESRLVGGRILPKDVDMTVSTLLGHALQHLILVTIILTTWSLFRAKSLLYTMNLLVFAVAGLLMVEALDVPFVLYGGVQDLVVGNLASSQVATSPSIAWMHFLNGGGRQALSIVAALLTVLMVELLFLKQFRSGSS